MKNAVVEAVAVAVIVEEEIVAHQLVAMILSFVTTVLVVVWCPRQSRRCASKSFW